MAFTYDPSNDAWVLELKPIATLNNINNMSSSPANQSVAFASDDPKTPASFNDRSRVGVTGCWESIKERFTACFGNQLRNEEKKSMLPSQCGCYRQASGGDRDEKLSEAIVYCKKTMRQEEEAAGI